MGSLIPTFILAIGTMIFIALLAGGEIQGQETPQAGSPPEGIWDTVGQLLVKIWGTVIFMFSVLSFNVPGAPWYVRVLISTIIVSPILWAVASLIRGRGGGD
jgi:hypothetical protein